MEALRDKLDDLKKKRNEIVNKRKLELESIDKDIGSYDNLRIAKDGGSREIHLTTHFQENFVINPNERMMNHKKIDVEAQVGPISGSTEDLNSQAKASEAQNKDHGARVNKIETVSQISVESSKSGTTSLNISGENNFKVLTEVQFERRGVPMDCSWSKNNLVIAFRVSGKYKRGYILYISFTGDDPKKYEKMEFECTTQPSIVRFVPGSTSKFVVGAATGALYLFDKDAKVNPVAQSHRWEDSHLESIISIMFGLENSMFTVALDGSIWHWDIDRIAKPTTDLSMKDYNNCSCRPTCCVLDDSGNIFIGSQNGKVVVKKTSYAEKEDVKVLEFHSCITGIDFKPGAGRLDKCLCVATLDGEFNIYTIRDGSYESVHKIQSLEDSFVNCALQPNSGHAYVLCHTNSASTDKSYVTYHDPDSPGSKARIELSSIALCCGFNKDGSILCVGTEKLVYIIGCPQYGK